ncbi:Uncharacterised protein [Mycolicibacterium fortuitum]|uniref:Lipoprotein n=1 Tax=Mycolicibacterium fortuitum TaxID=1766 RepID=A0A378WD59_MYCFO|nr:Uncharacterised protein [Mycolicibacterium fortuitum]
MIRTLAVASPLILVAGLASGCRDDFSYNSGYDFGTTGRQNDYRSGFTADDPKLDAFRRCIGYKLHAETSSDASRLDSDDFMEGCMDAFGFPRP